MIIQKLYCFVLAYWLLICGVVAATVDVPALRKDEFGGTLGDIDCRMKGAPNYDWKNYRDEDKVTWAHEGTHSINARIRNENKVSNGYYLIDSKGITLSNPQNLTLREVASAVPAKDRGKIYNLYMVQQAKYWNDTPLYCIDELVSYINGAIVGVEYGMARRAIESCNHATEMYNYCMTAYELCKVRDYKDIDELRKLMLLLSNRIKVIQSRLKADFGAVLK